MRWRTSRYRAHMTETRPLRIGFVGTRFAGTDGVSLESEKWADELRAMGHDVFYFAEGVFQDDDIAVFVALGA